MLRAWAKTWSRAFLIGLFGVILVMAAVDQVLVDFEYVRVVDLSLFTAYLFFGFVLCFSHRDFFER